MSAIARRGREGLSETEQGQARERLSVLAGRWSEVLPSRRVRLVADCLLFRHAFLRSADALQLAAGLRWCSDEPRGREFVSRDDRLRAAVRAEGFLLLP